MHSSSIIIFPSGASRVATISRLLAIAALVLAPSAARAQTNRLQSRIHEEITDTRLTVLDGQTRFHSSRVVDRGRLDPATAIGPILLSLKPTDAQQAQLEALLDDQQDPSSPRYHHWISPEEFGAQFGLAQSDVDKLTSWLTQKGLTVVDVPPGHNSITFVGPSGAVESAFHTEIHKYLRDNAVFHANSTDPSVPSALAEVVRGFVGLDTYPVHHSVRPFVLNHFDTLSNGTHSMSPADFAVIYDLNPLYNSVPAIDGAGQTIAVLGSVDVDLADINLFRSTFGLPVNPPVIMLLPGDEDPGVDVGDLLEANLDLEWSGAVAPNATIIFVNSVFAPLSFQYAIAHNLAPILSSSIGYCEADSTLKITNSEFAGVQQAAAQGITILSASGDSGSTDCEPIDSTSASTGLSVDVPGSFPYVTSVGGAEFSEGPGDYWSPANSATFESALSYIPEVAWNDGSSGASGGGVSTYFAKPVWQTGAGVPNDNMRDVPDVALDASRDHDGIALVYQRQVTTTGGTSFGAPAFAGIVALLNQYTNTPGQGNINYMLYPMAASVPAAFHDITSGNNMMPCTEGTTDCPNGGSIGYSAGPGYDQVTGLGSVDANVLITNWWTVAAPSGTAPFLSAVQPISIAAGSGNFTLTATGSGFSTGAQILWNGSSAGVTMQSGGTWTSLQATIASSLIASAANASITVTNPGSTASGAQNVIVGVKLIASPSALNFSIWPVGATPAAQTVTLTNNLSSAVTISGITLTGGSNQFAQTNNCGATIASGATCSISISFTPLLAGSPTAKLSISDSASASPLTVTCTATVTRGTPILTWLVPSSITYGTQLSATQLEATSTALGSIVYTPAPNPMPAVGSYSLYAAFTPTDPTDYAPTQLLRSLIVSQASTTLTIATSNNSVAANTPVTFTATVLPQIGGVPTGSVTFYDGHNSIGTGTLKNGKTSVAISSLAVGSHSIAAYYFGDSNFVASNSTNTITQTITAQLTVSPLALNFSTQPVGATPAAQTVTLANNLGSVLAISGIAFTGAGANQFAQTTNCGATLASGSSCSIIVTLTPLQVGAITALLSISDNAATSPQTVTLTGTATVGAPTLSWPSPPPITYGTLLSATQLDATSSVLGTCAYTPAPGTVPAAGSVALLCRFTPQDQTDYASTQLTRTLTVTQANSSVVLHASIPSAVAGSAVLFSALVQPQIGGAPTGTITFFDGPDPIGAGAVSAAAPTSLSVASLAVGAHNITASYSGDSNFTASTSTVLTETVTAPTTSADFTFAVSGTATQTASAGQTVTFHLMPVPSPATESFANPVTFSATKLPSGATATFSPATLPAGTAAPATPVTLTLQTVSAAHLPSSPAAPSFPPTPQFALEIIVCSLLVLGSLASRTSPRAQHPEAAPVNLIWAGDYLRQPISGRVRRALVFLRALAVLSAIAVSAVSCASGTSSPPAPASTTYSIVVTATSGTISHAITVTLTLN
jgi:hypothetical protein